MGKLVVLNIVEGDFERGFQVFLEIATEGEYSFAEAEGRLPSAPELLEYYKNWQTPYLNLVSSLRSSTRLSVTGFTTSLPEIKTASQRLKHRLNNWLDSPEMHSISKTLSRNLTDESEEIRFIIKTKNSDLQRLPWHLWDDFFQHYRRAEIALSLPLRKRKKVNCRNKARILAVFGNKENFGNTTTIDTDKDWLLLQKHLPDAELVRLVEPQLEELYEQLEKHSPDLFFFAGHSSSSEENGSKGLIELNQDERISIDDLKPALREAVETGLQLAIFNSCDGLGIAQELASLHVPHIIVMREPVPDLVAQKFLQRFLEAFTGERSLCLAVRRAREKIHTLEPRFPGATWLPIIFQNPAEVPLTGREFLRLATGNESNQVGQAVEMSGTGNSSLIPWLLTKVSTIIGYQNEVVEPKRNSPEATLLSPTETKTDALLDERYKVVKVIGQGGFGETYLAEDTKRPGNPYCVVKQLKPTRTDEKYLQLARRFFHTEAQMLEKVGRNDRIPQLLAYFEVNREFYLVQEYIKGHSLSDELIPGKKLSEPYVVALLKDVSEVLQFIHSYGVIHRDIKPGNIMRREGDGRLVLIDFGSVKQLETQIADFFESNTVAIGTSGYAPPEQLLGKPVLNSDIYALGMIGIQALVGIPSVQIPKDPSTREVIWRDRVDVNDKLAAILDKMVAYRHEERYQSADELLQALQQL